MGQGWVTRESACFHFPVRKSPSEAFFHFWTVTGFVLVGMPVLQRTDNDKIQLGGIGSDLLLGSGHTTRIRLLSGISDVDGDCLMLSS